MTHDEVRGMVPPRVMGETPGEDAEVDEGRTLEPLMDGAQRLQRVVDGDNTGMVLDATPMEPKLTDEERRKRLASKIVRYARWSISKTRAWEDEIRAHMAVASYHRQVKEANAAKAGVITRDQLDAAWDEAETAMEMDRRRRRNLMRDFVSFRRTHVKTQDGQEQPVYAAMAAR